MQRPFIALSQHFQQFYFCENWQKKCSACQNKHKNVQIKIASFFFFFFFSSKLAVARLSSPVWVLSQFNLSDCPLDLGSLTSNTYQSTLFSMMNTQPRCPKFGEVLIRNRKVMAILEKLWARKRNVLLFP